MLVLLQVTQTSEHVQRKSSPSDPFSMQITQSFSTHLQFLMRHLHLGHLVLLDVELVIVLWFLD